MSLISQIKNSALSIDQIPIIALRHCISNVLGKLTWQKTTTTAARIHYSCNNDSLTDNNYWIRIFQ